MLKFPSGNNDLDERKIAICNFVKNCQGVSTVRNASQKLSCSIAQSNLIKSEKMHIHLNFIYRFIQGAPKINYESKFYKKRIKLLFIMTHLSTSFNLGISVFNSFNHLNCPFY